jgi:hypothetical protein
MSGLLAAASAGDLAKIQRLIREGASVHEVDEDGDNAVMLAIISDQAPVVHWLLKEGGARISDGNKEGWTALKHAIEFARCGLVQWLLEEGGAKITDTAGLEEGGEQDHTVWDHLFCDLPDSDVQSLLKVLVLFGDPPPADFDVWRTPEIAEITIQGRQIHALRPSYLEQQKAFINTQCTLPSQRSSINRRRLRRAHFRGHEDRLGPMDVTEMQGRNFSKQLRN